jgi:hypothetical protein
VAASEREGFRPLRTGDVAGTDPLNPFDPEGDPDPVDPLDPPAENPAQAALAVLKELGGKLGAKNWVPASAADYVGFAEFASSATTIADLVDQAAGPDQEERQRALVDAIDPLAQAAWPSEEQIAKSNELTKSGSLDGDQIGVFAYAQCTMRPENFSNEFKINGVPVYGFQMIRSDEILLIPISQGADEIPIGSEWVVLGQKTQEAQVGTQGQPLRRAIVVHSKYLLKRPE